MPAFVSSARFAPLLAAALMAGCSSNQAATQADLDKHRQAIEDSVKKAEAAAKRAESAAILAEASAHNNSSSSSDSIVPVNDGAPPADIVENPSPPPMPMPPAGDMPPRRPPIVY